MNFSNDCIRTGVRIIDTVEDDTGYSNIQLFMMQNRIPAELWFKYFYVNTRHGMTFDEIQLPKINRRFI